MADFLTSPDDINAGGGYRQTIDGWYYEDVTATLAATEMNRLATTTEAPKRFIAARAGSITAVAVKANTARTAGSATVEAYINGVATGLQAILNASATTFKATTEAKDVIPFVAGDELSLYVSSDGAWLPVTCDIRGVLEVEV